MMAERPRLRERLEPLLQRDLVAWTGLPSLTTNALRAAFGPPALDEEAMLGAYPARRHTYPLDVPSGGFAAFVRDTRVLMIEPLRPPPLKAARALGEPCAVLPHELQVDGAYVHEYLYCRRGLVLSVSEPFDKRRRRSLLRCRGFAPIDAPDQFGPELFRSADQRIFW